MIKLRALEPFYVDEGTIVKPGETHVAQDVEFAIDLVTDGRAVPTEGADVLGADAEEVA